MGHVKDFVLNPAINGETGFSAGDHDDDTCVFERPPCIHEENKTGKVVKRLGDHLSSISTDPDRDEGSGHLFLFLIYLFFIEG